MAIIGRIRKHSWIAVLIVGVAIIAFILGDLTKNRGGIPDVGSVNGEIMTRQRFDELVANAEYNYREQYQVSQVPADQQARIRESVWSQFVDETLLEEQTGKLGMTVTPAELGDMYTGKFIHPYNLQNFTNPQTGLYDTVGVRRTLENFSSMDTAMRLRWVELEKSVKQSRLQQKYASLIAGGFYMPKTLAAKVAEYGSELSNVRVAALPFHTVSDEEVTLTDADYKKYYDEHKAEFRVYDELRDLVYIAYPVNPTPQDLAEIESGVQKTWSEFQTIEDEEIPYFVNGESYRSYDSNYVKSSAFRAPLDAQIEAASAGTFIEPAIVGNEWMMAKVMATAMRPDSLRASLIVIFNSTAGGGITRSEAQAKVLADSVMDLVSNKKMDFEAAVEQFSDDPSRAENHGDQQWQPDGFYGLINEQIVSTPVGGCFLREIPGQRGYWIVKVTDKTPATKKYRVALITRPIEPSKATNDAVYTTAHKFASQNRTLKSFEATAQQDNLQVRTARVWATSDNLSGLSNARDIVRWAYNDKTEAGMVADQVYECDGVYVVAALKDVFKKGYATLDQVRTMIEPNVRLEKKAEMLLARADEAVKAGNDINSVATKLGVAIDTLDSVSFNAGYFGKFGMEPKVLSVVAATKSGLTAPVKGASAVFVVQVDGKEADGTASADNVRMQMEQGLRNKMRQVTEVLRMKADVKDNRIEHF